MQNMHKAVFLDRDGTIIEDVGYLNDPRQIKFIPGAIEAIKLLNENGYKVIVITNQAGVARGLTTEDMVQTINKVIHRNILNGGGVVEAFYYCPHHPEHGVYPYRKDCECRKPHPGLVKKAEKEHQIDLSQSFIVGDKESDLETGTQANIKSILVLTGTGENTKKEMKQAPAHISANLLEAAKWIVGNWII